MTNEDVLKDLIWIARVNSGIKLSKLEKPVLISLIFELRGRAEAAIKKLEKELEKEVTCNDN